MSLTIDQFKSLLIEAQSDGVVVFQSAKLKDQKAVSLQAEPALLRKWYQKLVDAGVPNVIAPSPHPTNRSLDSSYASLIQRDTTPVKDMSF